MTFIVREGARRVDTDDDSEYGQITNLAVAFVLVVLAAIAGLVAAGYLSHYWPQLVAAMGSLW